MNTLLETWVLKLLGKRYLPVWLILVLDLTIVGISFLFALLLLTNFSFYKIYSPQRLQAWVLLEFAYGFSFVLFSSYQSAFRHTGVRDLTRLLLASVLAQVLAYTVTRVAAYYEIFDINNLRIAFLILQGFSFIMGVLELAFL